MLFSAGYALATSLTHADIVRPTLQASPLPGRIAAEIAGSDVFFVPPADQRAAIARVVKRNQPLYCAGTKKYAALTFDDGPNTTTPELLKLLRHYGIPATFFTIGKNIQDMPDYARDYPRQGATGNHTWDHASLPSLSPAEIKTELKQTQDALAATAGPQYKIFRPPYGAHNAMTDAVVRKLGYMQTLWSADSRDALNATPEEIAKNVLDGLGPGSVILMHDRPPNTLIALKKKILPAIHRSDLTMVTVPQLLTLNPPSLEQLDAGPRGCSHAGKVNVSGYFGSPQGERIPATLFAMPR